MRPTRTGWVAVGLTSLSLFAALASGNNLLYLLYGLAAAAILLSAAAVRWAGSVDMALRPERAFQGLPARVGVLVRGRGALAARDLRLVWGSSAAPIGDLAPGEERLVFLEVRPSHRGFNELAGLAVETTYPLGLFKRRLPLREGVVLAFPLPREARSAAELEARAVEGGSPRVRPGGGEDFHGLRGYSPQDDPRRINWKRSARAGELLVNEFSDPSGDRVTIEAAAGPGEAGERLVREAASACRFYVLKGFEVRLKTPESEVAYGRGLGHLDRLLTALALLGEGRSARPCPPGPSGPPARPDPELAALTHAGSLLVYASLFLIEELPRGLLWSLAPLFPAAWWMDFVARRSLRTGLLPEAVWRIASPLMLAYVIGFGWRLSGVTLANTHLLLYLFVHGLLTPKGPSESRRLFLILFLAFFLVSGQTISLWYFPALLLYAFFAGAWLHQDQAAAGAAGGSVRRRWRAWAAVAALCLAGAGLIFLATPRLEPFRRMNPFVAMGLDKRAPDKEFVVGFTENVSLGFFGRLKRSAARVLRVRPLTLAGGGPLARDRKGRPRPPAPYLRVRGGAFDFFDGRGWRKDSTEFSYRIGDRTYHSGGGRAWAPRRDSALVFPGAPTDQRTSPTAREIGALAGYDYFGAEPRPLGSAEFSLFPLNSSVLFRLTGLRRLEGEIPGAYFDHTDTVYFPAPYLSGASYRAYFSGPAGWARDLPDLPRLLRERYLQLPELDPRVRSLALRLTEGAASPEEKAARIIGHLRGSYAYSRYSDDPRRDLSGFLFSARSGNCEYFATAGAVLLRSAGVPARLVTGFLADEWNEYGGFYDVRQGQAHAWVEVYLPGTGWVAADPTPPSSELALRRDELLERLKRYFEATEVRWYRYVIGYDRAVQSDTFYRFRLSWEGERLRGALAKARRAAPWGGLAAFSALAALLAARRLTARPPGPFERVLAGLRRSGLAPRSDQTPREFAGEVRGSRPELAELAELVELHYRERFSGRALSVEETARAEALARDLERRVSATSSSPRRPAGSPRPPG